MSALAVKTTALAAKTRRKPECKGAREGECAGECKNLYVPVEAKVLEFYRESPDNFTLTLSAKLKHDPGQFVQIYLPGVGECPISICSYSGDNMKLNIREAGSVTNALAKLKKGDSVFIRGPYGRGYPMHSLKGKNLVFVGGGCGVAPLKGVLEYVAHHRKDYGDVALYFGFRSPSDLLFKREHQAWKARYKLNISVDQDPSKTCYDWKVGFVTVMLEEAHLDGKNAVAVVCGPPRMMSSAIAVLKNNGFSENKIYVSLERLMYCGVGKCCHCMIRGKFACVDGPVFRLDELEDWEHG